MKEIQLTNSPLKVKVDDEWFNSLSNYQWHLSNGYVCTGHFSVRMHDLLLTAHDKATHEVHHKDNNPLNNQIENLVVLPFTEHLLTRPKQSNNSSGYKGVYYKKPSGNRHGAWIAQLTINGKRTHLGRFSTAEEAARAYDKKAKEIFGDVAFLNNV